jgi:hypothetical protein
VATLGAAEPVAGALFLHIAVLLAFLLLLLLLLLLRLLLLLLLLLAGCAVVCSCFYC